MLPPPTPPPAPDDKWSRAQFLRSGRPNRPHDHLRRAIPSNSARTHQSLSSPLLPFVTPWSWRQGPAS